MSRAYLLQPAARLIAAALQQIIALANGSTATTQSATDNSDKIATTKWAWSLPAIQQIPDGTAAGGNARGTNAVDWQSQRTAANQVASGVTSAIGGGENNVTTGTSSTIGGGSGNQATALRSTVGGGGSNQSSGTSSCIPGGQQASTRGIYGKFAYASGIFTAIGDAQLGEHVLRRQTTDATATRLTSDNLAAGSSNVANLTNLAVFRIRAWVVAKQTGAAGDVKEWMVEALIKRGASAAATSIVGTPSVVSNFADSGAANWNLAVAADATNGGIAFTVTGEAGKTINWGARVSSMEVVG